jgi:hypothetical protein
MTLEAFIDSLKEEERPAGLALTAAALWFSAKGEWDAAHELVQDDPGPEASWVHAYLHRLEGDDGNASYWYTRAGRSFPSEDVHEEWKMIARAILQTGPARR